jgi:hypothetical protein
MGGTNENDDGTHGRQDGAFLAITPALERSGGDLGQVCSIEPIDFARFCWLETLRSAMVPTS